MTTSKEQLLDRIRTGRAKVGVVGLGYVGLPFAVEKARVGYTVLGIDSNPERAASVNAGRSYIQDVRTEDLAKFVEAGLISATTDYARVPEMDVVVICVPTPLTKNLTPDLTFVEQVTRGIAAHLRPGQLVSLESTTYPGTTEEVMLPILNGSSLKLGSDFFLAHSPERVDPGNARYTTKNTSKVVGGVDQDSLDVAVAFYAQTIERVVPVHSTKVAELTKVYENTFRAVNIALVNELALLCDRMGISVWEVLEAAHTKPFGIMPFFPGPGVGGHCIPIDPHYLEWKAKEYNFNTRFIALAGEINRRMPEFVREKALRVLGRAGVATAKARVLVLGVAYKRDLADHRESPSLDIIRLLAADGAAVSYHDPFVPEFKDHGLEMRSVPLSDETLQNADLVIIATDHSAIDYQWVVDRAPCVLDTRNTTKLVTRGKEKVTLL